MSRARRGDWVEISNTLLEPKDRAPGLPPDTAASAYTMRVRGTALEEGAPGELIVVRTQAGRTCRGVLEQVHPRYDHDFGACIPELVELRERVARLMRR